MNFLPDIFAEWTEQCKRECNYRSFIFKWNITAHPPNELDWYFCWMEDNIVLAFASRYNYQQMSTSRRHCLWVSHDKRKHLLISWKKNSQVWQVSGCAAPFIRRVFAFVARVFLILRKNGSFSSCLSTFKLLLKSLVPVCVCVCVNVWITQ